MLQRPASLRQVAYEALPVAFNLCCAASSCIRRDKLRCEYRDRTVSEVIPVC